MINTDDLAWSDNLSPEVAARWDELVRLRRELHQHPEVSWQEHETSRRVAGWLRSQGIAEVKQVAGTGVVALVRGSRPGPTIMYRADIDALPIAEPPGVDFASRNEGVMHACGHDGHTAIALMLASTLHQRRSRLRGSVKVVFQPAEEGGSGGARAMIAEGVLDSPKVDAALGLELALRVVEEKLSA